MTHRDLSMTIALCASLAAHGALALVTFEGARRQLASVYLPGHARSSSEMIEAPIDGIRLGGLTAEGLSPNASPGWESSRAKEAPGDQALLSRDPQGPGRIGDLPSFSLVPPTDGPPIDATPIDATPIGATPVAATPVMERRQSMPVLPTMTDIRQPFGAGPSDAANAAPRLPRVRAPARASASSEATQASSRKPAADPAVMSPSESDAFSTLGGVEFRDGRMESRFGRSFKSIRPRLSFAAQLDLMSIANPRLVLKITIDATGAVTAVDVVKSTGSTLIDQPVKVAMYQWWFEPTGGANGQPMADAFLFPISWH